MRTRFLLPALSLLAACSDPGGPVPIETPGLEEEPEENWVHQDGPLGTPCQLIVATKIYSLDADPQVADPLESTRVAYDFDARRHPIRREELSGTNYPGVISFSYDDSGRVVRQEVDAGPGKFSQAYHAVFEYDAREFPVTRVFDVGQNGTPDFTTTYSNTFDDLDLRSRLVHDVSTLGGQSTTEDREETWTPDEQRTKWTYQVKRDGEVTLIEHYSIENGSVSVREVDLGGNGTIDFVEDLTEGGQQVDVQVQQDAFGRPVETQIPAYNEKVLRTYEGTCPGYAEPLMRSEPKFRTPGTTEKKSVVES